MWTTETRFDPFIGLTLAADATERARLCTGLAVAFARNPMTMAMSAHDLHTVSEGRFVLGIGSQIKPHITRRFSMPWSAPAARMREFILAMRAIWHSFQTGERLRFRGEFYRHTLLGSFFDPGPSPHGPPPVLLAGVGELMTEVAGEVADGFLVHSFSSRLHLEKVALPALRRGREKAGRSLTDFQIHVAPFVVSGRTEQEYLESVEHARAQLAYYASVPGYAHVLELHGLGEVGTELYRLAAEGRADEAASVIDDDVLDVFAIVGEPKQAAAKMLERFGDIATSMAFYQLDGGDPDRWAPVYEELRAQQVAAPGAA
ncbi:putative F420-dependent oxidoreductase [Actinoalloteichus hymeniacidonis]|nr:putative F420-dependent oxidoreductase [Actinoalloteichus hymeniacidonis]